MYKVSQSVHNESTGKNNHVELFSSASEIQIVLFLRNLWYAVNRKPIPETNKVKGAEVFEEMWKNFEETSLQEVLKMSNNYYGDIVDTVWEDQNS